MQIQVHRAARIRVNSAALKQVNSAGQIQVNSLIRASTSTYCIWLRGREFSTSLQGTQLSKAGWVRLRDNWRDSLTRETECIKGEVYTRPPNPPATNVASRNGRRTPDFRKRMLGSTSLRFKPLFLQALANVGVPASAPQEKLLAHSVGVGLK